MGFLLGLNAIFWIAGFLLPVPCFILALHGWFKRRNSPPAKAWRRKISQAALGLFALGLALWIYALLRDWSGRYVDYGGSIGKNGRWGGSGPVIPPIITQRKDRAGFLLWALGLLFYFFFCPGGIGI